MPVYKCRVCGAYTTEPVHCGKPCVYLMSDEQREALSHLMSALLRHIPHEAGLKLDEEGFVDIDELVRGIRERWRNRHLYQWVTRDHVLAVAALDPRGRFEVRGNKIRATYGHSIPVRIRYQEDREVKILYHGTVRRNLPSIMKQGLIPGRRLYVHMTTSKEVAREVGTRHGEDVVILKIDADCVRRHGYKIYRASPLIYLAKYVPPQCIEVDSESST